MGHVCDLIIHQVSNDNNGKHIKIKPLHIRLPLAGCSSVYPLLHSHVGLPVVFTTHTDNDGQIISHGTSKSASQHLKVI